jgi:hypothetical protein
MYAAQSKDHQVRGIFLMTAAGGGHGNVPYPVTRARGQATGQPPRGLVQGCRQDRKISIPRTRMLQDTDRQI